MSIALREQKAFLEAVSKGKADAVLRLLGGGGIELNPTESNDETHPLYLAAQSGDARMTKILLERGAGANAALTSGTTAGRTPLMAAAYANHVPVVQLLIEHGADVNAQREAGWTALHYAAAKGCTEAARLLLDHGANKEHALTDGKTPEARAYERGHTATAYEISTHVFVAVPTSRRTISVLGVSSTAEPPPLPSPSTPLATPGGSFSSATFPGLAPPSTGIVSSREQAAFVEAISKGRIDVVRRMLEAGGVEVNPAESTKASLPLVVAAAEGHVEILRVLLERGANVNASVSNGAAAGWTPLIAAVERSQVVVVTLLLDQGTHFNAQTVGGWTALHMAAAQSDAAVIQLLLAHGADRSISNKDGETPESLARALHGDIIAEVIRDYTGTVSSRRTESVSLPESKVLNDMFLDAISKGNERGVWLLLGAGALDLNPDESDARTLPLAVASKRGHVGVVKLLVEAGADVNVPETAGRFKGRTALMTAAAAGHTAVVQLLIDKRAELNAQTELGYTALHYAAANGHLDVVRLLLDKGAEKTIKANDDETPEQQARSLGKTEAADLVRDYAPAVRPAFAASFRQRTSTTRLSQSGRPARARTGTTSSLSAATTTGSAPPAPGEASDQPRSPNQASSPLPETGSTRMSMVDSGDEIRQAMQQLATTNELTAAQRANGDLQAQLRALEAQLASTQEQARIAGENASKAEERCRVLTAERAEVDAKLSRAESALAASEDRARSVIADRIEMRQQLARAETGLAAAQQESATSKAAMNQTITELRQQNDALQQEILVLKADRDRQVASLESDLATARAQVHELDEAAAKQAAHLAAFSPEIPTVDVIIDARAAALGTGANGEVRAGHWHGTPVAVKRLFATLPDSAYGALTPEEDASVRALLRRECDVLARLRCPYLVTFYGFVSDTGGRPEMIIVEQLTPITRDVAARDAVCVARDMARALRYLHQRGVIHRDIKLSNVLLDSARHVYKLSDLGEAQLLHNRASATYTLRGTQLYLAPEVLEEGVRPTPAIDVFAFGVTVVEIFTNQLPAPTAPMRNRASVDEVERRRADLARMAEGPTKALAIRCLAQTAQERPTARECALHFETCAWGSVASTD